MRPTTISRRRQASLATQLRVPPAEADTARPKRYAKRTSGDRVGTQPEDTKSKKLALPVVFLLVALFLPWNVNIGSLSMTPYRLVLIVMIGPAFLRLAGGEVGRIRVADITLLLFSLWCIVAFAVDHGLQVAIQSGGVQFVETMGGYLVARTYIRSSGDFYRMGKVLFILIVLLLPLAVIESITGRPVAMDLFSYVLPGHAIAMNPARLGFRRVQGVFEHAILFGVVSGSAFAITHLVLGRGKSLLHRWSMTGLIAFSVILSLSSGPISSTIAQAILIGWGWVLYRFKGRWKILIGLIALAYLMVTMFAKRSVPALLFTAFALDVESAYYRLLIWNFGTQSVINHPWFGTGFGEWDRPYWMQPTIDMFWLYNAITFGLPGGTLMFLTFLSAVLSMSFKQGLDDTLYAYRSALIITLVGMFLVGWTVHFWGASYVLFLFLVGSGAWISDTGTAETPLDARTRAGRIRRSITRSELRPAVADVLSKKNSGESPIEGER